MPFSGVILKLFTMEKPSYEPDQFPHWTTISVRFRDLDTLNHVNNAIFSTYYEEARIRFIQEVPELASQLQSGFSFVLARLSIHFIKPVTFPSDILIGSGVKKLGNSSITSFQAIYLKETKALASVAEASGVWFDLDKQRPSRIPDFNDRKQYFVALGSQ
jgi:acyl-CoA thioester hydrolase